MKRGARRETAGMKDRSLPRWTEQLGKIVHLQFFASKNIIDRHNKTSRTSKQVKGMQTSKEAHDGKSNNRKTHQNYETMQKGAFPVMIKERKRWSLNQG